MSDTRLFPVPPPAQPAALPGWQRRRLLAGMLGNGLALATGAAIAPLAAAQGAAYEVARWGGPVSAIDLPDITGKTWRLADLKGRPALLNFWASWCEPCRAEMPTLQQIADLYGPDKLSVLAVNFKEPAARAIQFARTTGVTLPVLLDVNGNAAKKWGVKVFPTTLMLDAQGRPRLRVTGEVDWTSAAAEKLIASLGKT